jgi:hypothetical protein
LLVQEERHAITLFVVRAMFIAYSAFILLGFAFYFYIGIAKGRPPYPATLIRRQSARSSGDRALPCGGRGRKFESCRAHSAGKSAALRAA